MATKKCSKHVATTRAALKTARRAAYYQAHREDELASNRAWAAAHSEQRRAIDSKYRKNNPEKVRARRRKYREKHPDAFQHWYAAHEDEQRDKHLKRTHRISLEIYRAMEAAQGEVCAICKRPETVASRAGRRYLAVDHDHAALWPGCIRGLLCHACNLLLGRVEATGVEAIVGYLGQQEKNNG
jgi:hypothetical protein